MLPGSPRLGERRPEPARHPDREGALVRHAIGAAKTSRGLDTREIADVILENLDTVRAMLACYEKRCLRG